MAGPMRDDFFSLLSSFGLETIVESAHEGSLPLGDGPIWLPPGLEAMVNNNSPGHGQGQGSGQGQTPSQSQDQGQGQGQAQGQGGFRGGDLMGEGGFNTYLGMSGPGSGSSTSGGGGGGGGVGLMSTPTPVQDLPVEGLDLTNMGMGEFLEWTERRGRADYGGGGSGVGGRRL